jgi:hypothetical protein
MNPYYRIYKVVEAPERAEDRSQQVESLGCNGTYHALWTHRTFLSEAGSVVGAEDDGAVHLTPCDGTCGTKKLGFFRA